MCVRVAEGGSIRLVVRINAFGVRAHDLLNERIDCDCVVIMLACVTIFHI